jgi:hypothetical protein
MKKLKQSFEVDLPKQYKLLLNELSLSGWYIDYNLPLQSLAYLLSLDYKNKTLLDKYLMNHFSKKTLAIKNFANKNITNRRHIINSAFNAHSKKQYELSIPVFLSQIDGICYDLIEKDIFSRGRRNRRGKKENIPKEWVRKLDRNNLTISLLEQINNNEYISADFSTAKQFPFVLNRNLILHGRITDYCTRKNSLKVISLLNYIITIVSDIKRNDGNLSWF